MLNSPSEEAVDKKEDWAKIVEEEIIECDFEVQFSRLSISKSGRNRGLTNISGNCDGLERWKHDKFFEINDDKQQDRPRGDCSGGGSGESKTGGRRKDVGHDRGFEAKGGGGGGGVGSGGSSTGRRRKYGQYDGRGFEGEGADDDQIWNKDQIHPTNKQNQKQNQQQQQQQKSRSRGCYRRVGRFFLGSGDCDSIDRWTHDLFDPNDQQQRHEQQGYGRNRGN